MTAVAIVVVAVVVVVMMVVVARYFVLLTFDCPPNHHVHIPAQPPRAHARPNHHMYAVHGRTAQGRARNFHFVHTSLRLRLTARTAAAVDPNPPTHGGVSGVNCTSGHIVDMVTGQQQQQTREEEGERQDVDEAPTFVELGSRLRRRKLGGRRDRHQQSLDNEEQMVNALQL